jgi:hypothetical protein
VPGSDRGSGWRGSAAGPWPRHAVVMEQGGNRMGRAAKPRPRPARQPVLSGLQPLDILQRGPLCLPASLGCFQRLLLRIIFFKGKGTSGSSTW